MTIRLKNIKLYVSHELGPLVAEASRLLFSMVSESKLIGKK